MDNRLIAVLSVLILSIAITPAFQLTNTATSEITDHSVSKVTVNAAYKVYYVGSVNSNVYHKSNCRYVKKIKSYNKRYFKSKANARAHGYRPCKICRP